MKNLPSLSFWLKWLGVLTAALSLFNLTRNYYNIGISYVFKDLLSYYQSILYPPVQLIKVIVSTIPFLDILSIPEEYIVFFIVFTGTSIRNATAYGFNMKKPQILFTLPALSMFGCVAFLMLMPKIVSFAFKGWSEFMITCIIGFPFYALMGEGLWHTRYYPRDSLRGLLWEEYFEITGGFIRQFIIIVSVMLLFFTLNAFAPSVPVHG